MQKYYNFLTLRTPTPYKVHINVIYLVEDLAKCWYLIFSIVLI